MDESNKVRENGYMRKIERMAIPSLWAVGSYDLTFVIVPASCGSSQTCSLLYLKKVRYTHSSFINYIYLASTPQIKQVLALPRLLLIREALGKMSIKDIISICMRYVRTSTIRIRGYQAFYDSYNRNNFIRKYGEAFAKRKYSDVTGKKMYGIVWNRLSTPIIFELW